MCRLSDALKEFGLEKLMEIKTRHPFLFVGSFALRTATGAEWPINDVDILCFDVDFATIIAHVAAALGTILSVKTDHDEEGPGFYRSIKDRVMFQGPKGFVDIFCVERAPRLDLVENVVNKYDLTCYRVAYTCRGEELVLHEDVRSKRMTVTEGRYTLLVYGRYPDVCYPRQKTLKDAQDEEHDLLKLKSRIAKYQSRGFKMYGLPDSEPDDDDIVVKDCPICGSNYASRCRPATIVECGHVYCETCILKLMERDPTCPACKTRFVQFKRLFFQ